MFPAAKELLHSVVDGILMPRPDGYAVRVTLKATNPAIRVDGGAGDCEVSCGGVLREPYTNLEIPVEVSLAA